jgi:hypothetical protein
VVEKTDNLQGRLSRDTQTKAKALRQAIQGLDLEARRTLFPKVDLGKAFNLLYPEYVAGVLHAEESLKKISKDPSGSNPEGGPVWMFLTKILEALDAAATEVLPQNQDGSEKAPLGRPKESKGLRAERNAHLIKRAIQLFVLLGQEKVTCAPSAPFMKWLDLLTEILGVERGIAYPKAVIERVAGNTQAERDAFVQKLKEPPSQPPAIAQEQTAEAAPQNTGGDKEPGTGNPATPVSECSPPTEPEQGVSEKQ